MDNTNDEITLELKPFEKLISNVKKAFVEEDKKEGLELISKILSVAIYADKEIRKAELEELKNIIDEIVKNDLLLKDEDKILLESLVKIKLNDYEAHSWKIHKDTQETIKYIIDNGEWNLAEYMVKLFESDGLSDEEKIIKGVLDDLIKAKKVAYKILDL